MVLQHQEKIKTNTEVVTFDNSHPPTRLAPELLALFPGQARVIAFAIHEKLCERGEFADVELWETVLRKLREGHP